MVGKGYDRLRMNDPISCPNCNHPVDRRDRRCKQCGVDIAVAAALAERSLQPISALPVGLPITPEILVPRLGEYLVEKGLLTQRELVDGLAYQHKEQKAGRSVLLGQALREMGLVEADILDQAITEQIYLLQSALHQANTTLEQRVLERTQELQVALRKLQELNQLKANFIANISHELRTPLTHMKGYLEMVVEGGLGDLNAEQANALDVIRRAETRLEQLIEDLIQFSLASRGELELRLEPVNLAKLVDQVMKTARSKAETARLALSSRIPDRLPLVYCDREKITWVITQLLDNAIKFTPPEGKVQVAVQPQAKIVSVSVIDSGIGIPKQRLPELFEPFHQLDGTTTRRYSGTGLGLALCQQILQAHRQAIRVDSVERRGSRFEFSLDIMDD